MNESALGVAWYSRGGDVRKVDRAHEFGAVRGSEGQLAVRVTDGLRGLEGYRDEVLIDPTLREQVICNCKPNVISRFPDTGASQACGVRTHQSGSCPMSRE